MKASKNTYRAIACTLLLIAGGLYYFNKDEPPSPPPQPAGADPAANVVFSGSTIVEQQDGKKQWELTAGTVQVNPATKKIELFDFKGTLYRQDGSKVDLTGRRAEMDTKTKNIMMQGDVKAVASDGAAFTAAEARWASQERRLYGSGGIRLTREDAVITGDRIESDDKLAKVKVTGNARAVKGGTPQ